MILGDNTLANGLISFEIESFEQTLGYIEDAPGPIQSHQSFHLSKIVWGLQGFLGGAWKLRA
jgi:hypothetical protein